MRTHWEEDFAEFEEVDGVVLELQFEDIGGEDVVDLHRNDSTDASEQAFHEVELVVRIFPKLLKGDDSV